MYVIIISENVYIYLFVLASWMPWMWKAKMRYIYIPIFLYVMVFSEFKLLSPVIFDFWWDIWYLILDIWWDIWYLIFDIWYLIFNIWSVKSKDEIFDAANLWRKDGLFWCFQMHYDFWEMKFSMLSGCCYSNLYIAYS